MTSPAPRYKQPGHRRGAALLAVLWLGVIGGILLMSLRHTASMDLAMGAGQLQGVRAHWAARAGIEQAMATLAEDATNEDGTLDIWYDDAELFDAVALDTGSYTIPGSTDAEPGRTARRFGVTAVNARLNINEASTRDLTRLIADREEIAETVPAAIRDWRDSDGDSREGGAEAGYYANQQPPYEPRDAPLESIHELRLIKDVTPRAFYGEDANLNGILDPNENDGAASAPSDNADGELELGLAGLTTVYSYEPNVSLTGATRVNINSASAQELTANLNFSSALARAVVQQRDQEPFDNAFGLLEVDTDDNRGDDRGRGRGRRGRGGSGDNSGSGNNPDDAGRLQEITLNWLAENLDTITTEDGERQPGKININLAPRGVLLSLPGVDQTLADNIISQRSANSGALTSLGELLQISGVDEAVFRQIAPRLTVRSNVFEVRAIGRSGPGPRQVTRTITAVIDREASPVRVLRWQQD